MAAGQYWLCGLFYFSHIETICSGEIKAGEVAVVVQFEGIALVNACKLNSALRAYDGPFHRRYYVWWLQKARSSGLVLLHLCNLTEEDNLCFSEPPAHKRCDIGPPSIAYAETLQLICQCDEHTAHGGIIQSADRSGPFWIGRQS
ncbi:hypothetical protein C8J57DRAFT_1399140 [Mycena rebaudengoi]|nr:hypothetical protein C8J57DRAFT_1399140 [Mycena rebaudengoi]